MDDHHNIFKLIIASTFIVPIIFAATVYQATTNFNVILLIYPMTQKEIKGFTLFKFM